ncbi:hypothetical protein B0H10DRAFT_1397671 [Mycena sp. CBHHK59/15]|nr:hypothetical protein B0H10DRAFT_1397671 [Mycena sp. CBHHK59/15]
MPLGVNEFGPNDGNPNGSPSRRPSLKRPQQQQEWDRDRDRNHPGAFHREQVNRAPQDRSDQERDRNHRQGPYGNNASSSRGYEDDMEHETRDRGYGQRGYQPQHAEDRDRDRERRDVREHEREQAQSQHHRDREREREHGQHHHRDRDPNQPRDNRDQRDREPRRDLQVHDNWQMQMLPPHAQQRGERDGPPGQYERKQDPPYSQAHRDSRSNSLAQSQNHPRDRESSQSLQRSHSMMSASRSSQHASQNRPPTRSMSASPPPPVAHFQPPSEPSSQRKREKTRFAPPGETQASSASTLDTQVAVAFGLVDRSMVDAFVPDELLKADDVKEPERREFELVRERERERDRNEGYLGRRERDGGRGGDDGKDWERDADDRDRPKRQPLPPQDAFFHEQGPARFSKPPSSQYPLLPFPPPMPPFSARYLGTSAPPPSVHETEFILLSNDFLLDPGSPSFVALVLVLVSVGGTAGRHLCRCPWRSTTRALCRTAKDSQPLLKTIHLCHPLLAIHLRGNSTHRRATGH